MAKKKFVVRVTEQPIRTATYSVRAESEEEAMVLAERKYRSGAAPTTDWETAEVDDDTDFKIVNDEEE